MRLAIACSHPIQYYAPLFRELARRLDLHVFYAHLATPSQQAAAGFGQAFDWDIDLVSGYDHSFLTNVSSRPGTDHFFGCDTPEIADRLAADEFDALMVIGWNLKSSIQAIMAAKRLGLPVLVRGDSQLQTRRSPLKAMVKALAYPPLLRSFDAALYVGQRSRAYYRHYRFPEARLFFSPHCIDNDWFASRATAAARQELRARLAIAPSTFVALFAGKLLPFKRPLDVVESCALASRQGAAVEMMLAGSGGLGEAVRARAQTLGVRLHDLGFCNQTEMPPAYAAADVLMLPSDARETWGLVCNEALACGTPIIVSEAAGCADDLAADAQVGAHYRLGDVDQAARLMLERIARPAPKAGIAALSARYSLSAAAGGIIQALEAVAPGGAAR
jgi:glycosyltransferase involved in cell wall biosynthesis